ncbi:TonB-dependent receptor [Salegentibacter sp. HM20]
MSDQLSMKFSISDEQGRYRVNLERDSIYILELSYLGYQKITDTLRLNEDVSRNFQMQASNESLDEIFIKQKMAVLVREDTITYRTEVFKTGEERKLREVLKKLPGVEVDRDGNVTVNGKKVDKLMVDGKTFFTGDTKLAVENIPADAVDEVEVLDNYSEVPFLKGLEDSDKMAMNIKLSEGKKKFVFGDIEAGGGPEERYIVHPTLFYYSPNTSVNVIGDFNNIGKRSFSMDDYINFEGGILSLMDNPGGFSIYNDDFARFLSNEDFVFSKNDFGAFNVVQRISDNLDLNAYTIASKNRMEMLQENNITYVNNDGFNEFRETRTNNNLFFSLSKLQLRFIPHSESDLTYDAYVKTSRADGLEQISSQSPQGTTFVNTQNEPDAIDFTQNLKYSKQFSYKHTTTATVNYKYNKDSNYRNWNFNRPLFSGILPLLAEDDTYELLQNTSSQINKAAVELKHYWILNNTNHIYPVVGFDFLNQEFKTFDAQVLNEGEINDFSQAGLNNDLDFRIIDQYFGLQYKKKVGDLIIKPGLFYHFYLWNINQLNEQITNKTKPVLLPEFEGEYEIHKSEKIKLKYRLNSRFTDAGTFANRLRLISFNRLFQGNQDLENELFHSASLTYYKFSLFKGLFLNTSINYIKRLRSVRNTTIIEGIDQITSSIYTSLPEETYSFSGSFSQKISDYKFTLQTNLNFSDYSRIINEEVLDYESQNYAYTLKAETSFKNLPNLDLGVEQRLSKFGNDNFNNDFVQLNPYAVLEYDFWNGFILKADYQYNYFENKTSGDINRFEIGNFSLFYNKEDSPWGFELAIHNIFNAQFRRSNSFTEFIITDQRIFIQPRVGLLKIVYKL